ncbi:MAG: multi-sensor signal transduction histidine kinase [Ignavibacteria bacterium]|nr:multi-sensor signal transduction histidine kinase [Ignavibacteria bacterium]
MSMFIKALIIEDSEIDTKLIINEMKLGGLEADFKRVDSLPKIREELINNQWDVIIADYLLSGFNGLDALKLVKSMNCDTPFMLVSGAVEESLIVEAMKSGANDCFIKGKLLRLAPAIMRAIEETDLRKKQKQYDELEKKVEERTSLLIKANEQLQREINERILTEKQLKKTELHFKKIFEFSPIGISISRMTDRIIIDINNSFLKLLGYEKEEIIGKDVEELNIWVDMELRERLIERAFELPSVKSNEVRFRKKNGEIIYTLMNVELIVFEEDSPWIIFMVNDNTDRAKAHLELANALNTQTQLNALKTKFISMISHEFRTPLTTIMLSTDLLKRYSDKWEESEKNKHFQRIQDTILKMTQSMEQILIFSKIESGKFELHIENIDLYGFASSIIEDIGFNYGNDPSINISVDEDCYEINADENLLGLILTNLLNNAVKYSPKGTLIDMKVYTENDNVKFVISDNGIGIPSDDIPNLFKTFYRASNVGPIDGYGLGLSIVRKCVTEHGGNINVESKLGLGTIFTFTLPK